MTPPPPKYAQAAALVRAMVADGTLAPGQLAPSGNELARMTGFADLTCRRGLRTLVAEGILTAGASPSARPRVAAPATGQATAGLARAASSALAARRRNYGLSQPELAALIGYSTTAVGHAETGRLWQSRAFWEKADTQLEAGGELIALYDAYRAQGGTTAGSTPPSGTARPALQPPAPDAPRPLSVWISVLWSDGTITRGSAPAPGPPGAGGPVT